MPTNGRRHHSLLTLRRAKWSHSTHPQILLQSPFSLVNQLRPSLPGNAGNQVPLAYFSPVIEEVLRLDVSPDYFRYLRHGIARITAAR